uniref:Chromatin assembly factor 1 subunit B-like n=1 Tax=Ciona intestinalis TaxID=7719 RepID=F6TX35_CIOIN|nr:chromatin assembly factor 1 subunit B-like isoform X1 [Ciona intestinalis]|eukprot:XP_002127701.1 chromatin assembly factor 1 subunit B-like isoform X1 [Ciona intestinalis]
MKVTTPEISWHAKEAIFSIDVQPKIENQPQRIATAGLDNNVRVWEYRKGEIRFLSNLSRHDKAVNIVRFSKSGVYLASAGDDATVILWKLSEKEEAPNIFDPDDGKNIEVWCAAKILRGHLEDINDLCWSSDDLYIVTGSVDHTAVLWDVNKGQKMAILSEAKHFVHGVAWDPLGQYVATLSCDRSLRIYNTQTKKMVHCINKMMQPTANQAESEKENKKMQRLFHDESVVRRRLSFSKDGKMLIAPAGCLQVENEKENLPPQQINTALIFPRGNFSKPVAYLPGLQQPASIVACSPVFYKLKKLSSEPSFKLEYRCIFAVASNDTVVMYDTQQVLPFAVISNIHYASITDLSWSSDGLFLVISSRDGFCSLVEFDKNELGEIFTPPSKEENTESTESKMEQTNNQDMAMEVSDVKEKINDVEMRIESDLKAKEQKEEIPQQSHTPRRVKLTPVNDNSPSNKAFTEPKTIKPTKPTGKSAPRRIQLTPVTNDT